MKHKLANLIYTFVGNATFAFIKWLILILIVRLTDMEQVGVYTFSIALTAPIVLLVNMRLRVRYVVEDNLSFSHLTRLRNLLNVISLLIISIITLLFFEKYFIVVLLVAITKLLDLNSDLYYAVYHKKSMFKNISLLMIFKSLLIIIVFGTTLLVTKNLIASIVSQVITQVIWLFFAERRTTNQISISPISPVNFKSSNAIIWGIFLASIPLGFVQLLNSYNVLIPRYLIENKLSISAIGIFAAISYLLTIVDLFMNAISQNFIINIKNKIKNNKLLELKRFITINVISISLVFGGIIVTLSALFGNQIIFLIYGEGYANKSYILVVISFSIIFTFQSWMYDTTLMALENYKVQLIAPLFTLAVSIIASYLLISNYGLLGAAISIVCITFTQAIVKLIVILFILERKGV